MFDGEKPGWMKVSPFLSLPHSHYKDSYIAAVREFIAVDGAVAWDPAVLRARFDEYLLALRQRETEPLAGMVPATTFWLIRDGRHYAGELDLRHHLNPALERYGGHIGYGIRPSMRRQGLGRLILALGIREARRRGIGDLLLTCDDSNIGSRKIIEANGGLLVDKIDNDRGVLTRRYRIPARA